jgi:hypothetical protein
MAFDPVYEKFVLPYYQAEQKWRQKEAQRADKEQRLRQQEAQRADKEAQRAKAAELQAIALIKARQAAENRMKHLEAELARLKKR